MSRLKRVIYILGSEGAGKTTQASFLYLCLYLKGISAVITEIRSQNLFMYTLSNFLKRIGRVEYYKYPDGNSVPRLDSKIMRKLLSIWTMLEIASFAISWFVKVAPLLVFKYVIIYTRYATDLLVDLISRFYSCSYWNSKIIKLAILFTYFFLVSAAKPSVTIYLEASYSALVNRYIKRGSYVEPKKWIIFYKRISKKVLELFGIPYYYCNTTNLSKVKTFKYITNHVLRLSCNREG